jgi:hypothetical protein
MTNSTLPNEQGGSLSRRQEIYFRYIFFVLVDLTVLNLFVQYWELVFVESFSISLMTALLLQVLMQATMAIVHRITNYFKKNPGVSAKIFRCLSTWAVLFSSKLVILEAIDIVFVDSVMFAGPMNGLIAFIVVVTAMIVAEQVFQRIYNSLA